MNHQIRDFLPEDLALYLELSAEFFSSSAVLHPVPEEHFRRTFEQCVQKSPYARGLLLLADGEPAGYALLSLTWSNEVGGLSILMEEAYISPQHQGKGLGSALFDFVEKEYVKTGQAKRLRLEVTHVNERAISLYERQGFERLDYVQMIRDFA